MCIAIATKPGAILDPGIVWRGWTNNRDGAGFAFVDDAGVLHVRKGFTQYNDFYAALRGAYDAFGDRSPFIIHMRFATAGARNKDNTHPFSITPQKGPKGAFIHNGTMFTPAGKQAGRGSDAKSDSRVFGSVLNNILSKDVVKMCKVALERKLTARNKIVFLYEDKELIILNEDQGFWDKGIWYSNYSCTYSTKDK